MPKFTDQVLNFWNRYQSRILLVTVIVVFAGIGLAIYMASAKPIIQKFKSPLDTGNIPNNSTRHVAEIYFFNADWCPHCTSSKPEWQHFCEDYNGAMINGYLISCIGGKDGTNCTDTTNTDVIEKIEKFKVDHFPTIKLVLDGSETVDFDAKVTYDNLYSFVKTVVPAEN